MNLKTQEKSRGNEIINFLKIALYRENLAYAYSFEVMSHTGVNN